MPVVRNKQNEQPPVNSGAHFFALLITIVAALAIILSLVAGGMKLFGDSEGPTEAPTGEVPNDNEETYQVEAWRSNMTPLSDYSLHEGSLIQVTDDSFTPEAKTLKDIMGNNKGQFTLANSSLKLNKDCLEQLVAMATQMNTDCNFAENLSVNNAYDVSPTRPEYKTALAFRFRLVLNGVNKSLDEATVTGGMAPNEWLASNAWKYGFIARYPAGSLTSGEAQGISDVYRYTGFVHASYISHAEEVEEGQPFSFEDYMELVRTKTAKNPLVIEVEGALDAENDGTYNVYYVSQETMNEAEIRIGATLHEISGDNRNGYIVTVKAPVNTSK